MQKEPPRRLKILALSDIVAFPTSIWPIDLSSSALAALVRRDGFALIIHTFKEERHIPEVGTLAMVLQALKHREKNEYKITFQCLGRVNILGSTIFQTPEGAMWESEWQPVLPVSPSQEIWQKRGVQLNLELLSASLGKIYAVFEEGLKQIEIQPEESDSAENVSQKTRGNLDDLEALIVALKSATPQNIENALDRSLDTLERLFLAAEEGSLKTGLLEFLRGVLWTIPMEERLTVAAEGIASIYLRLENFLGETDKKTGVTAPALITALLSQPREAPLAPPPVSKDPPKGEWRKLDLSKRSQFFLDGFKFFRRYVVNQDRPIEQLLRIVTAIHTGLLDDEEGAKVGGLFLGPTGVGKTESVKILARFLFDDPTGFIYVEGSTLMQSHSVARFTGAEPGYIGYDEGPKITQWGLDRSHVMWMLRNAYRGREEELQPVLAEIVQLEEQLHNPRQGAKRIDTESVKQRLIELTGWRPGEHLGLVLADEIEKAHENVQHFFLRVLNDGVIQLANGEIVICRNAIFVFTGNIYGREIAAKVSGRKRPIGIRSLAEETAEEYRKLNQELYDDTLKRTQEVLLPEFFGRIGKEKVRVFHPFSHEDVREIIERLRLPELAKFLLKLGIKLYITEAVILFLQKEVWDPTNRSLGARAVKSIIERKIKEEVGLMLDLGHDDPENGVVSGDSILIDVEAKEGESGQQIVIKKFIPQGS